MVHIVHGFELYFILFGVCVGVVLFCLGLFSSKTILDLHLQLKICTCAILLILLCHSWLCSELSQVLEFTFLLMISSDEEFIDFQESH